jgi:Mor family transcriptional regulator
MPEQMNSNAAVKTYQYLKRYLLKDGSISTYLNTVKVVRNCNKPLSKAKMILADGSKNLKELAQKYNTTENYCYTVLHRRAHA